MVDHLIEFDAKLDDSVDARIRRVCDTLVHAGLAAFAHLLSVSEGRH